MSTIVLPLIIQGPAVIEHNGRFIYVQKDVTVDDEVTDTVIESAYGTQDKRLKSRAAKVSFTPVGQMTSSADFNKLYPFGPANIGQSIFPAAATLKIHSLAELKVHTFTRGGVSKFPEMYLGPTKQALGGMEMTCLGKNGGNFTDADYLKGAIANDAFNDASFDDSKIFTDIYNAALGARPEPFDAMGAHDIFTVKPTLKTKNLESANVGIADIIIDDLEASVEFAPSNVGDADLDTLLSYQGAGALVPGQSYSKANEDLVIDSDSFTATLYRAGARQSKRVFEKGQNRMKMLEFVSKRYGNIPAASPLWLFTVN